MNHTLMTGEDDSKRATYAYLISEDDGRTYRMVGTVDWEGRKRIEAKPVQDKGFMRMFGRIG